MADTRYVFVTGDVASSLGKGIISASLAKLLQSRSYNVTIQKLDPYLNIDPGTLNPYEHGECYVTEDAITILYTLNWRCIKVWTAVSSSILALSWKATSNGTTLVR